MIPSLEIEFDTQPDSIVPSIRAIWRIRELDVAIGPYMRLEIADVGADDYVTAACNAIAHTIAGWNGDVQVRFDRSLHGLANAIAGQLGLDERASVEINDCGSPSFCFGEWSYGHGETLIYLYREV